MPEYNTDLKMDLLQIMYYGMQNYSSFFVPESELYEDYKNGKISLEDEKLLEMDVLRILEELGFSVDNIGTHHLKKVVAGVIKGLEKAQNPEDYETLKELTCNSYSQFYFDIVVNDLDLGLKTFHSNISDVLNKIRVPISPELANIIACASNDSSLVFELGQYCAKKINGQGRNLM